MTKIVQKDGEPEVEKEILASAILDISRAAKRLTEKGGLSRAAVIILVAAKSGYTKTTIAEVLQELDQLERWAIAK